LMRETPNFAKQKFLYRLSRSDYEKEWGKDYVKPGFGTRVMSTLLRYMPKVGPFKAMAFNYPTAATEDLYVKSVNTTVDQYRAFLEQVRRDTLVLPDRDLDSGLMTKAAEYPLADDTYAKLLSQLKDRKFNLVSPELRTNILAFYADPSTPLAIEADAKGLQSQQMALAELRAATPNTRVAEDIASKSLKARVDLTSLPAIVVGFVGGFIRHDDPVHSEVQLAARLRKDYPVGVTVQTFESYHGRKARKTVLKLLDTDHDGILSVEEKQSARIIIYGHSWGGYETIDLARELEEEHIPVLLTIQVDSVSKVLQNDAIIPANVIRAANFYQPNGMVHGQSEIRAADPSRTNIVGNFRFDYKASPYNCVDYPWYDRVFAKPHTQIECDPRVWEQAEFLIRSDLPARTVTSSRQ
jgi:hypothetical protein